MVPEIALLSQIYARLSSYFPHQVGLWHNQMQQSEKKYILSQIKQNNLSIMIVTRSGLFLPLKKLGLIIVDEEHSSSYKQEANEVINVWLEETGDYLGLKLIKLYEAYSALGKAQFQIRWRKNSPGPWPKGV